MVRISLFSYFMAYRHEESHYGLWVMNQGVRVHSDWFNAYGVGIIRKILWI